MSVTFAEVVRQTRLAHPAFTREAVPNVVLAEGLSDYQRELIKLSADRLESLVVDRFSIVFDHGGTDPAALLMTATGFGVVTGVPALREDTGLGISLGVDGIPVNSVETLTANYEDGLILPVHHKLLNGTAAYQDSGTPGSSNPSSNPVFLSSRWGNEFTIIAYDQRMNPPRFPSGYVLDGKLYLVGASNDWLEYASIDMRYVPLPGNLNAASTFRLPEICREALNAKANLVAARWASANGRTVDVQQFLQDKEIAEAKVLSAVSDRQSKMTRTMKRNR